jgi:gluconate kinase
MQRRKTLSSFDLFLDTVCNTFGGVLFIALLVAIQVRHSVEQISPEACSPKRIAELLHRTDELALEIESAVLVLETIRKTMPEPDDEYEKHLVATYSELLEKKNDIVVQKAELSRDFMALAKENAELSQRLKDTEEQLIELKAVESQLSQTVQNLLNEQPKHEQKIDELRNLVSTLETETAQKTVQLQDKNAPDRNSHTEELILPRMRDAGRLRPFYLVLRYNRLYVVANRSDFDAGGDDLGTPKKDRGSPVMDSDLTKHNIRNALQSVSPATNFIGIFVYGDSVDSFYIVRNAVINAGFRYELIPSMDDSRWFIQENNGATQIQ